MVEWAVGRDLLGALRAPRQHRPHALTAPQGEARHRAAFGAQLEQYAAADRERQTLAVRSLCDNPALGDVYAGGPARVVEARIEEHFDLHHAFARLDQSVQLVRGRSRVAVPRHEVRQADHPAAGLAKEGLEDIRGVIVGLQALVAFPGGSDAERAALPGVEDAGKDTRGIEARQAEPVDGTVHADQRTGVPVAHGAVHAGGGRRAVEREGLRQTTRSRIDVHRVPLPGASVVGVASVRDGLSARIRFLAGVEPPSGRLEDSRSHPASAV